MKIVYQTSENDCALAALAMVLQHYGRQISLYELKMRHPISTAGVSIFDLKTIAKTHGLDTRAFAVKGDPVQLESIPTPFIAHWGGWHFSIVTRIARGRIELADPRDGRVEMPIEQGMREWGGAASANEGARAWSGVAIFMSPDQQFRPDPRQSVLGQWLPEIRKFGWMLAALLVLSGVLLGASYLIPLTVSRVVSDFMEHGQLRFDPGWIVLAGIGFVAGYYAFNWAKQILLLEIRLRLDRHLSERFTSSLFRLPYTFFNRMPFGDLLARLGSVTAIREFISSRVAAAVIDVVMVTALAILIFVTDHRIGIIYLGSVAIVSQAIYLYWPTLRDRFRDEVLSYTGAYDSFSDALMGIQDIKANRTEEVFFRRWRGRFHDYLDAARGRGRLTANLEALLAALAGGVPLVVLLSSLWLVNRAQLGAGDAILAYLLVQFSMASLVGLLGTGIMLQQLVIHTDRVDGISRFVAEASRVPDDSGTLPVTRIVIDRCGFSYTPGGREVLSQVDLCIERDPGFVVVMGASGSGKSTLLKLLTRTLHPTSGAVRYFSGDQEIEPGQAAHITSIIQESAMFRGTLMENVTMFNDAIAFERVSEACRIANIHDEILAMPMGYNTPVEGSGANLSGGQRQRLALARALVNRPSMLVLDEFTSSLDSENERRIISNLRRLDCKVIVATHRTAWIDPGDRIVDLHQGSLRERLDRSPDALVSHA